MWLTLTDLKDSEKAVLLMLQLTQLDSFAAQLSPSQRSSHLLTEVQKQSKVMSHFMPKYPTGLFRNKHPLPCILALLLCSVPQLDLFQSPHLGLPGFHNKITQLLLKTSPIVEKKCIVGGKIWWGSPSKILIPGAKFHVIWGHVNPWTWKTTCCNSLKVDQFHGKTMDLATLTSPAPLK